MAWINIIEEDEAQGELKGWYDKLREPWGEWIIYCVSIV